jgi:hypothetical protein
LALLQTARTSTKALKSARTNTVRGCTEDQLKAIQERIKAVFVRSAAIMIRFSKPPSFDLTPVLPILGNFEKQNVFRVRGERIGVPPVPFIEKRVSSDTYRCQQCDISVLSDVRLRPPLEQTKQTLCPEVVRRTPTDDNVLQHLPAQCT